MLTGEPQNVELLLVCQQTVRHPCRGRSCDVKYAQELGDAGKPAPADFLEIRCIARILSQEALRDYASDHKQPDENSCDRQIGHRKAAEKKRQ